MRRIYPLLGALAMCAMSWSQTPGYEKAPAVMTAMLEADHTPTVSLSPSAPGPRRLAILQPAGLPTIQDLAQPEYRLAGLRFNPEMRFLGRRQVKYLSLKLKALPDGKEVAVTGFPAEAKLIEADWSPDGRKLVAVAATTAGLSLWIVDAVTAHAMFVPGIKLNAILNKPCMWVSDSKKVVCLAIPANPGAAPKEGGVPTGPAIQQNLGRVTPARTNEDMLQTPLEERIFEYYASSVPTVITLTGATRALARPALYEKATPSPNGRYVLLEARHRPFSYLIPVHNFPLLSTIVETSTGQQVKLLGDKPMSDAIPISFDAVEPGARGYGWRSDAPATVSWVYAEDGGDPKNKASVRDAIYTLDAPFRGEPKKIAALPLRVIEVTYLKGDVGITWGNDHVALAQQEWHKDRELRFTAINPSTGDTHDVISVSLEDHYADPGLPLSHVNASGAPVLDLTEDGTSAYFTGVGSTPRGDHPFISSVNLDTGKRTEMWRSADKMYDFPYARVEASTFLVRRESPTMPPNYFLTTLPANDWKQLTAFANPYGNIPLPEKKVLHYKRKDGVELSADLYLPPGYKTADDPLPTLMHAYPVEYKSRDAAGQVTGSEYMFPRYTFTTIPILFTTQGYAVMQNTAIPIVGQGKEEPNDTYVEQIVAGAQAAVDEGRRLGVVDPNRVAVIGHSYGAFMTSDLLAHSNLFKTGISMSGAYNRTLTPFGFQREERVYWQVSKLYYDMSPFSFADRIKTPILLFHGAADDNQGTFPIQSDRFYAALKGNGATVRFVSLPLEAHVYAARESLETVIAETKAWLDTYVKNAPASR